MISLLYRTLILGALCFALTAANAASSDELNDLAGRLQFNFYAADARSLQQAIQEVEKLELDGELGRLRDYQMAYGQWKLAETLRAKDRSAARRAADACIEAANKALEAVPKRGDAPRPDAVHAEVMAIQAGCFGLLSDMSLLPGGSRARKAIEAAMALQPSDPRVLLVNAEFAIAEAKSAAQKNSAVQSIAAAVAAFDAQTPLPPDAPDWGYAEALTAMGDVQLQVGNRIAARNALERALVLAPDFSRARKLLTSDMTNR